MVAARAGSGKMAETGMVGGAQCGPDGEVFAKGIAGVTTEELAQRSRGVEVVHRDRLVLY